MLKNSSVKKDIVVLPKSVTPSRISSNFAGAPTALSKLDAADIAKLDGVAAGGKQKRIIALPWGTSSASYVVCSC
jgi:glycerol 2-dehydrogenase (NADP+)